MPFPICHVHLKPLQLSTNSGYGAIHAAILSLSTRSLAYGQPFKNIAPQTDAEEQEGAALAFGIRFHHISDAPS